MKKNAFTLVELLVAIVILGIVTGISIPLIRNVRSSQEKKQYETYRSSLSYATKVYVDSFSEDLFGHDEIACATVSYNQLKSKNLIKDIPISGVSCASNDTYINVLKFRDQYSYFPTITCGKPLDDGIISKDVEMTSGNIDSDLCKNDTSISVVLKPNSSHTPNVTRKNISVEFKSNTGIHSDPIIYWAFSVSEDVSGIIGEWKQLDLTIPSNKSQKASILQGNAIILTKDLITPKNYSGKLYLLLRIDRLEDLGGKNWTKTDTDVVYGGYYAVDNLPPELNESEIKYSEPIHNNVTPTLDFKATDNLTSESNLRMCISEDTSTDNCSKNINDIKKKQNGWVTYDKSKVLPVMNNASNGENHNIFVSVGDQAGNYVTQQFVYYRSQVDYSITYRLDGGTHGASHPNHVNFEEEFTVDYPAKKITLTFVNNISGCSIDYSASTVSASGKSVNYTFNGWNITGMDTSTHTFGSRTSNKTEEDNVIEKTFKGLRHSSNGVVFSATWNSPTITLPMATKTGYTCVWKSDGIEDKEPGGKYKPAEVGGATSRTFTTSCSQNSYSVTLNKNGATNSPTASTTVTYGATKLGTLSKLPEKKYTVSFNLNGTGASATTTAKTSTAPFNGWYTTSSGGSKVASNAATPVLSKSVSGYTDANGKWARTTATLYAHFGDQSSVTLPAISKTGYTCSWNTNSDGSGTKKNGGISYVPNGNITFYARCTANPYTVSLNKNGATNSPTSSTTVSYGATKLGALSTLPEKKYTVSFNLNSTGASATTTAKTSTATFNGWYTTSSGGSKVASNATTPVLSKSVSGYTDANGKWARTAATTLYAHFGDQSSVTLPAISKTGYTCNWNTKSDGSGTKKDGGVSYTPSGNITFYARCAAKSYTVSLNKNGATNSPTSSTSVTYGAAKLGALSTLPEKKYTVSFNLNSTGASATTTAKTSTATFNGWYTTSSGGSKVASNASTPVLSKSVSGYTDANGKWARTAATTLYAQFGMQSSVTLPAISKTGYTCNWNTKSDGSGTKKDGGVSYTPSGNITFYARCTANPYTVSLNKNGATNSPTTSTTVGYGATKLGALSTLPEKKYKVSFSLNGTGASATTTAKTSTATFNGWYTTSSGGSKVASNASTPVLSKSVSGYTDANGKWTRTAATTLYAHFGDQPSVTLPSISKTGYTCNWNTKSDGSGTKKDGGVSYTPSGNITFYARCAAKTYKISYHGKSNNHGSMGDTNCTYDSNCKLRDNAFTKLGYTFLGWDTSSTAKTVVYKNSATVKNLTTSSSITLYAVWKENVWKVSSPEGGADTLQKAFDKASSGATLTLTKSYSDGYAGTNKTLTINLNGKKITESDHIQSLKNSGGTGNLTITGSGTIVTSSTALSAYGKLTVLNGTYETTNTHGHAVEVMGGTFVMSGGTLKSSKTKESVLIVDSGTATVTNTTISNTAVDGSGITVHTGAKRLILGSGVKISATNTGGTGMHTNIGSGDYIHVLQGASISAKKSSIGLNSGKLCLSDKATLSGNGKTGKDSIWKASGASIVGAGTSECTKDRS